MSTSNQPSQVIRGTSGVSGLPAGAHEQSQRKVSSVVIFEEFTNPVPQPEVRYVEVPQYEEVIKHVAKKEIREVEKRIPVYHEEWVERIVEVPQYQEVVKHVEIPQIQEVIKHVPKIEVHDRFYDVVKHVPKVEVRQVEKVVEVAGDVIEVPKPFTVEEKVPVPRLVDSEQKLIVAQTIRPVITEGGSDIHVDVTEYEPEVVPVDIHVAKFVDHSVVNMGVRETKHRVVTVPSAQYNSMLKFLNSHLPEEERQNLPFLSENGQIRFLNQEFAWCAPPEDVKIEGYVKGQIYSSGQIQAARNHTASSVNKLQAEADVKYQQALAQFESAKELKLNNVNNFNRQQEIMVQNTIRSSQQTSHTTYNYNSTTPVTTQH